MIADTGHLRALCPPIGAVSADWWGALTQLSFGTEMINARPLMVTEWMVVVVVDSALWSANMVHPILVALTDKLYWRVKCGDGPVCFV